MADILDHVIVLAFWAKFYMYYFIEDSHNALRVPLLLPSLYTYVKLYDQ